MYFRTRLKSHLRSTLRQGEEERMAKTLMLMVTAFTVAILPNFGVCILELLLTHKLYPMTQFKSWDVTAHVGMNAFG